MLKILAQFLLLVCSNAIVLSFIFFKYSLQIQYAVITILIILLVLSQRFLFTASNPKRLLIVQWLLFFLSSFLVELLVLTTGGFYSSFFILLHFYALGLGFFVGLGALIIFILLSAVSLFAQLYIDTRLSSILSQDPGSLILYVLSYFIIIPFSYFLAQQFQIKDKLAKILEKEVQIGKVVMQGVNELIIISNTELKILSVNDVVEHTLKIPRDEIIGKQVFDVLFLRKPDGKLINPKELLVSQILTEKTTKDIENLNLYIKNSTEPLTVELNIKSVPNLQGSIEQLTFIINNVRSDKKKEENEDYFVERIQIQQQAQLEDLRNKLISKNMISFAGQVYLIQNWTQDVTLAKDVKLISSEKNFSIIDVAQFTKKIVDREQEFSKLLNVSTTFELVNFSYEDIAAHVPPGTKVDLMDMTSPFFSAPVVVKWLDIMLHKLMFVSILLSLGSPEKKVRVSIERHDESILRIRIVIEKTNFLNEDVKLLFVSGYGSLSASSGLYFSSGIEGVLAHRIAETLGIGLEADYDRDTKELRFSVYVKKG